MERKQREWGMRHAQLTALTSAFMLENTQPLGKTPRVTREQPSEEVVAERRARAEARRQRQRQRNLRQREAQQKGDKHEEPPSS